MSLRDQTVEEPENTPLRTSVKKSSWALGIILPLILVIIIVFGIFLASKGQLFEFKGTQTAPPLNSLR